ncbi:MAG: transcriptional regulator NrdR [Parachlamydiaceae bacterium]
MKCPFCNHEELKVTDSREASEVNAIRRRRECLECQRRFTTFETVELTVEVKKRDGRYEDFAQQKLIKGIEAACNHTTVSREQVIAIASQITGDIMQQQVREITTTELGRLVMKHLQALDPIAYIRFACVYRRFKDVEELMDAIQAIKPKDDIRPLTEPELCKRSR